MPKVVLHTPMRFKPIGGSEHAQELDINELEKLRDGKAKIRTRCNTAAKFQQFLFFVIPIAYLSTPCFGGLLEAPTKSSFWLRNGRYQDLTRNFNFGSVLNFCYSQSYGTQAQVEAVAMWPEETAAELSFVLSFH